MTLPPLAVTGIALWAPLLPDWRTACEVLDGAAEGMTGARPRPTPSLLAPTERRRAPDTVAVALEVASAACGAADRDPRDLPSVFASRYGDLPICDYMCATLASTPTLVSPTKFHNSVHNAAAGYWTAGTQCHRPSTALLGGRHTFAAGLLESISQAIADDTAILFVAYDVHPCGPLAEMIDSDGVLALALVLDPAADGRSPLITARLGAGAVDPVLPSRWESLVSRNSMRTGLALLAAMRGPAPSNIQFPLGKTLSLDIEVLNSIGVTGT